MIFLGLRCVGPPRVVWVNLAHAARRGRAYRHSIKCGVQYCSMLFIDIVLCCSRISGGTICLGWCMGWWLRALIDGADASQRLGGEKMSQPLGGAKMPSFPAPF